ncbi:hypothetical protein ACS0TY_030774 [Phlomoides rotata]
MVPKKLVGDTMLNVVRANMFMAEVLGLGPREVSFPVVVLGLDPREVSFPVVGGHAGVTVLPLLSQVLGLDPREVSFPVVGGHAGVTVLPLLSQVKPPCSFTLESQSSHSLHPRGVEEVFQLGPLNEYERVGFEKAKKDLEASKHSKGSFFHQKLKSLV